MVDKDEVKNMMKHASKMYSGIDMPHADEDADEFIKILDIDEDGSISEEEFIHFIEKFKNTVCSHT